MFKRSNRIVLGLAASLLWIIFAIVIWFNIQSGPVKLSVLGDYLAGIVSPLAFIWFVIAYFQQGEELKRNTEALSTQREEMEHQAKLLQTQAGALRNAADALIEHTRPYVVVNLITDGISIYAVLKNSGNRSALNVDISFDPPLSELGDSKFDHQNVLKQSFMPPGREVRAMVTSTVYRLQEYDEPSIETTASVSYEDEEGEAYEESYPISLIISRRQVMQPKSVSLLLDNISDSLDETTDEIQKLRKAVGNGGK